MQGRATTTRTPNPFLFAFLFSLASWQGPGKAARRPVVHPAGAGRLPRGRRLGGCGGGKCWGGATTPPTTEARGRAKARRERRERTERGAEAGRPPWPRGAGARTGSAPALNARGKRRSRYRAVFGWGKHDWSDAGAEMMRGCFGQE